jgi:pilus assembly protein CpaF
MTNDSSPQLELYRKIKTACMTRLMEEIDLSALDRFGEARVRQELTQILQRVIESEQTHLTGWERQQVVASIIDEILGLGPLESLLADPTISAICVNGSDSIYLERGGIRERSDRVFDDDRQLLTVIERILARTGKRVDESSPVGDATLPDGSHVHVILPPLSLTGPILSIRRAFSLRLSAADWLNANAMTPGMLELLRASVRARLNVLVSGSRGAGKTSLLNLLSSFIPEDERIVTIEQSAELSLDQPQVIRLETRPPNVDGRGAVDQRRLYLSALALHPDRIVVGEIRGDEAYEMLQAMATGMDGALASIHAGSPRQALRQLQKMVLAADPDLPDRAILQQLASTIDIVVQLSRLRDGSRKVVSISDVRGFEGTSIETRELFVFEPTGASGDQKSRGAFRATGERPAFSERLLPADLVRLDAGLLTLPPT